MARRGEARQHGVVAEPQEHLLVLYGPVSGERGLIARLVPGRGQFADEGTSRPIVQSARATLFIGSCLARTWEPFPCSPRGARGRERRGAWGPRALSFQEEQTIES